MTLPDPPVAPDPPLEATPDPAATPADGTPSPFAAQQRHDHRLAHAPSYWRGFLLGCFLIPGIGHLMIGQGLLGLAFGMSFFAIAMLQRPEWIGLFIIVVAFHYRFEYASKYGTAAGRAAARERLGLTSV